MYKYSPIIMHTWKKNIFVFTFCPFPIHQTPTTNHQTTNHPLLCTNPVLVVERKSESVSVRLSECMCSRECTRRCVVFVPRKSISSHSLPYSSNAIYVLLYTFVSTNQLSFLFQFCIDWFHFWSFSFSQPIHFNQPPINVPTIF